MISDYPKKKIKTKKKGYKVVPTKAEKVGKHIGARVRKFTKGMVASMKTEARQQAYYRKQLAQQQQIEANRLAQEQRTFYEQPAEFVPEIPQQQEQFIEEEYGREVQRDPGRLRKGLSGFAEAFKCVRCIK